MSSNPHPVVRRGRSHANPKATAMRPMTATDFFSSAVYQTEMCYRNRRVCFTILLMLPSRKFHPLGECLRIHVHTVTNHTNYTNDYACIAGSISYLQLKICCRLNP